MKFKVFMTMLLLSACGTTALSEEPSPTTSTEYVAVSGEVEVPTTTVPEIMAPAVADSQATRITLEIPTTQPPFDPEAYCNALAYGYQEMGPAMECFRVAAFADGWTQQDVDDAWAFAYDLIVKESGGCWNLRGGDIPWPGTCFDYQARGYAEDTGFGQATLSIYGRGGVSCAEGYCSSVSILQTPYHSMRASVIIPLRKLGRYPWCDYEINGKKPTWHNCSLIAYSWRPTLA